MEARHFDTKVQYIKYKAIKEVARLAWDGKLMENILDVPKIIVPGKVPTMRCCVYKERAILGERVKTTLKTKEETHNVIQVIDIACEDCPASGYHTHLLAQTIYWITFSEYILSIYYDAATGRLLSVYAQWLTAHSS